MKTPSSTLAAASVVVLVDAADVLDRVGALGASKSNATSMLFDGTDGSLGILHWRLCRCWCLVSLGMEFGTLPRVDDVDVDCGGRRNPLDSYSGRKRTKKRNCGAG